MKVIREEGSNVRSVTLRISEDVMKKIDKIAEEHEISRQKLIEGILETAISDKSFVLRLK